MPYMSRNSGRATVPDKEEPTTELYVPRILLQTDCVTHNAVYGQPCYSADATGMTDKNDFTVSRPIQGICNHRALRAGFNGTIHPASLDRSITRAGNAKRL